MRIIFAGTPDFAQVALEQLHAAGFEIALVLSQPDRPAGRGLKLQQSAVKKWALAHQIAVAQPRSLRLDGKYPDDARQAKAVIDAIHADAIVVAAYGLILPQWVLGTPRLGCLNIHASLLPRWRGAAPIHRAIEAGDSHTGITIMQMDAGLDTGELLLVEPLAISPLDTTGTLHDKLAALGGRLIVKALGVAAHNGLEHTPQPTQGVTYAHKLDKLEAVIDWTQSAVLIARRIRAFQPFPIAVSHLGNEPIKFWAAQPLAATTPSHAVVGQVLAVNAQGVDICTSNGVVRATQLQRSGGKALNVADFLRGFEICPGMRFGQQTDAKSECLL